MVSSVLVLPHDQGRLDIADREHVRAWLENEMAFWQELSAPLSAAFLRPSPWSTAQSHFTAALTLVEEEGSAEVHERLTNSITEAVAALRLTSTDPRAVFLRELTDEGWPEGVVGATYLAMTDPARIPGSGPRFQKFSAEVAQGTALAAAQKVSVRSNTVRNVKRQLGSLQEATTRANAAALSELETVRQSSAGLISETESVITKAREDFAEQRDSFEADLKGLRETLKTELSLRAPTAYWLDKAATHEKTAKVYLATFVAVLIVGGGLLAALAWLWVIPTLVGGAEWWPIVLFSLVVAVWAWPLRLSSKLYLSHRHLREDSAERAVIARTFLALHEVVGLDDDDRRLLLGALFRGSSGGLVRDDASVTAWDVLAQLRNR